ncbi:MAG: GNAT family N-acetyltransferase [Chloroflexi bacterium]|nr:GNAT family N-acetyltransferase [Chloroflexota bacterium]
MRRHAVCRAILARATNSGLPVYHHGVTTSTLDAEPACPGSDVIPQDAEGGSRPVSRPVALRRPFDSIPAATWDALASRSPWATPFARWAFHRSWWDAYGASAHDQTVVVVDPTAPTAPPLAIVPLMHRHQVEPDDGATRTYMRHAGGTLTPVEPTATAVFFGASYHADYATVLADPAVLPAVAEALVVLLARDARHGEVPARPWDEVDLRRLRCGDPAADALEDAFRGRADAERWTVVREREDVCPVVSLPDTADLQSFLSTLGKKERHEIRRKVRRAEAAGEVRLDRSTQPLADLDAFIELHQKRWGAEGLFPPTPGGDCSRRFFRHLFRHFGSNGQVGLMFLTVGGRRIAAGIHFDDGEAIYYYNAGVDPDARDLSPGVVMVQRYVEMALALGRRRLDFLRGDESYKYEWGAVDEPIQRILVERR